MRFVLKATVPCLIVMAMAAGQSSTSLNSQSEKHYMGQTWVGLLVSDACAPANAAAQTSNLTVNGRTTTPAVDSAGTRGQAGMEQGTAERMTSTTAKPQTGDVLARGSRKSGAEDAGWAAARKQAEHLAARCRVGPDTQRFALLTPDGRYVAFDDAANGTIAKQVQAQYGAAGGNAILRVQVAGKLENGKIAVDTVQM